jgi:hypothetical protein
MAMRLATTRTPATKKAMSHTGTAPRLVAKARHMDPPTTTPVGTPITMPATAIIGIIIGIPLGVAAGQAAWNAFANNLGAVPVSVVPIWLVVGLAAGVIVVANLLAIGPALGAMRSKPARLLRSP